MADPVRSAAPSLFAVPPLSFGVAGAPASPQTPPGPSLEQKLAGIEERLQALTFLRRLTIAAQENSARFYLSPADLAGRLIMLNEEDSLSAAIERQRRSARLSAAARGLAMFYADAQAHVRQLLADAVPE